jgi:nicotinate-nucleotide adenylyltransferase
LKIAVFGGTFNPLHIGHAMLADTIIKELGYDKILFVPTFITPHKKYTGNVTSEQRLEMVRAFCASEGNGHFETETCEFDRGGVSYTSDTLEFLTGKYKDKLEGKLAFVMGDEVAAEFDKWRNPEKVSALADLIIVHRYPDIGAIEQTLYKNTPSGDYKGDFAVKFDPDNFKYPHIYIENPMLPVSSTDIRGRISEGKSFRYLVPPAVYEYIMKNGLYK